MTSSFRCSAGSGRRRWAAALAAAAAMLFLPAAAPAQTGDPEPPAGPANVRAVDVGEESVTVVWDAPEPEEGRPPPTGYRVLYRQAAVEPGSEPTVGGSYYYLVGGDLGGGAREGTVSGLDNGVWYEVTVMTLDGGWSEDVVLARPGAGLGGARPPDPPSELRTAGEGLGSVTVAWAPPADHGGAPVEGYEVWYRTAGSDAAGSDAAGSWVRSGGALPADAGSHTITGLENYRLYRVIAAAVNREGRGLFASELSTANREDFDPLGLIAGHRYARADSLGTDTWEVWVCDAADGDEVIDPKNTAALLNEQVTPYFSWLSEGRYRPEFVEGGAVRADAGVSSDGADGYGCEDKVAEASEGGADGALIVLDKNTKWSSGSQGRYASAHEDGLWQIDAQPFPENRRFLWLRAGAVLPISAFCDRCLHPDHVGLDTAAHEIGHALGWPHSFGLGADDSGASDEDEYNNPMDMVSGGPDDPGLGMNGLVVGTIAVNRYAAGWIDPDDAAVHGDRSAGYLLGPVGGEGLQMLALPAGGPGRFVSLGARVAKGYDAGLPAEGVEVYLIDQRASACDAAAAPQERNRFPCTSANRRTRQVPPPGLEDDRPVEELTDHVYGPGEELTVEGFRVEVTERVGDSFRVWVANPYEGTFADDDGSAHEASIERLVELGVAGGCDPARKRYCPDRPVTRAQMAKFLVLATGETVGAGDGGAGRPPFPDVAADAWYRPYVEKLAELGITGGFDDGTFRPDEAVTRAQMAVFLTRAFDGIAAAPAPAGVFADAPPEASYAAAVEGVLAAGVTRGCSKGPGRNYCPDAPVLRGQIASFLVRALDI